jgi:hypothetical protein
VAHGILVEFEAVVHDWNSHRVKSCLRDTLGSTSGASDTLNLFGRIEKKEGSSLFFSRTLTCLKIFCLAFLFRFSFLIFDLYTDIHLLKDYYSQWTSNVSDPDIYMTKKFNICSQNLTFLLSGNQNAFSESGDNEDWKPFEIPPR